MTLDGLMLTADFDFDLPADRIAEYPAPRGESRLFCPDLEGPLRHRVIGDLPELLRPGDLLVVNNTRVLAARLHGRRATGGRVELLLAERVGDDEWLCLARPGRRAKPGTTIELEEGVRATVIDRDDAGLFRLRFSEAIEPHLDSIGHMPLPPYIKRPDEPADRVSYQTVYAREPGSIAAPTAGLHFTYEILKRLGARGVELAEVTLTVGIGTFKPITAELVHEHVMDRERYDIPPETATALRRTRAVGGRIVAVGTTVVRTLEAAALASGDLPQPGMGSTDLFISPGFDFRVVDRLLTNFHLPRSSLLILVSAFAGRERILDAYSEAIESGYRFYSYGDAMLVKRR
jgi:S-adenosylmethionine:tRNA ribosyltransferase-isomerase